MADWAKESEAAAAVMQAADRALGEPLGELIANGPDTELNLTVNTQPHCLLQATPFLRPGRKRADRCLK